MRKNTVIPDAPVRIKILNELIKKSSPLHFSEIRELVHKQDAVIGRELKTLVKAGLVIKNPDGLYQINKDSKDYADFFNQLALNEGFTRFHYLTEDDNIHVFITSEEIDQGLIGVKDIYPFFTEDTEKRLIDSIDEIISAKMWAVVHKKIANGTLSKRLPIEKAFADFEAIKEKPCKIIITFNMPFFKYRIFEEEE